jgi:N6-adenosine-specific RNA methylase IME4/ParB-like chromosome segregation protein Spo0J
MEYRNPKELIPHPISVSLYGDNHIEDLLESIREYGILVPLTITNKNMIISGHRRWRCALELNIQRVPIEIKTFLDDLSEKQAILDYNRQRHKTPSQMIREAELLKDIIKTKAQINKDATSKYAPRNERGQLQPIPLTSNEPVNTAREVARRVGFSSEDAYRKVSKVWDKAQEGNEQAQKLIKDIDSEEKTINRAFRELTATEKRIAFVASRQELPIGIFDVFYGDPPWDYEFGEVSREIDNQYPTMTLQQLKDLALQLETHIADIAVLFLWATAPKLIEALEVMRAWGFSYRTNAVWDKEKIGMGYWFRGQHELLLVGVKGNYPPPITEARFSSVIRTERTDHSSKPDCVYEMIEAICPNSRYIELFSRKKRQGWESWGNQST